MFYFFFYGLFARQCIVLDVCIFQEKKDDYICVLLVPLSGSFGWTCLSAAIFLDRGFSCCAPGHDDPLETLPSTLKGRYMGILQDYTHFSHEK